MRRAKSTKDVKDKASAPSDEGLPAKMVLKTIVLELSMPLGIGLTADNTVSEVYTDAAKEHWQADDALVWVDGTAVRKGKFPVADALKKDRDKHTLVIQRMVPATPGVAFFTVRLTGSPGLGIGLTEDNRVSDLTEGNPAQKDGRLEVSSH